MWPETRVLADAANLGCVQMSEPNKITNPDHMDMREQHIRCLAFLLTKGGIPSPQVSEYLEAREYGLALISLGEETIRGTLAPGDGT